MLIELVVVRFVYYTDPRAHIHRDTDHTSDMMEVTLSEALSPVQGVNPDDHLLFVEFVWKFEEIPVRLGSHLSVDLLELSQVVTVRAFVELVVLKEHFL